MKWFLAAAIVFAAIFGGAQAATPAHIEAVEKALDSAYAVGNATNGCPALGSDVLGWPANLVMDCQYASEGIEGVAYLLKVKPVRIAGWIESACGDFADTKQCFVTVLECGRLNSGLMIAIGGNIVENGGSYFFRNGMTVRFTGQPTGSADPIELAEQRRLAAAGFDEIERVPSGLTRPWRTLPKQFATAFPNAGAPKTVTGKADREKWLRLAQTELLAAIDSDENRLLTAWVKAHPLTLAAGNCPGDADP